jgi:hypothetical protein
MRLPVSDLDVAFRLPDGHDDLAIFESRSASRHAAGVEARSMALERGVDTLSRLATLSPNPDTDTSPWHALTITDFEYALLGLRRFLFGDTVVCLSRCPCSERMEIEFSIAALLRDSQPRTPRRVVPCASRSGWFTLPEKHLVFRLPTVGDQLRALASATPRALLEQFCIESTERGRIVLAVVERAMEAMAPSVSRPIAGVCAACGAALSLELQVPTLVLDELAASTAGIHREIHAIAAAYHWPESTILALPQLRRQAYTEAILQGGAQ